MGRVAGTIQDGGCEGFAPLPRRRPGGESLAEAGGTAGFRLEQEGGDPPRAPDLDVLRHVLAGLRRLD